MTSTSPFYEECPDCHADPGQPCSFGCQSRWSDPDEGLYPPTWVVLVTTGLGANTTAYGPFGCLEDATATASQITRRPGGTPTGQAEVQVARVEPADTDHLSPSLSRDPA